MLYGACAGMRGVALDPLPRKEDARGREGRPGWGGAGAFLGRILAQEKWKVRSTLHTADEPNLLQPPTSEVVRRIRDPAQCLPIRLGGSEAQSILPKIMTCFSVSQ